MKSKLRATATCAPAQGVGLILGLIATPTAADTCWTGRQGQFFTSIQYCVSSVLAPQAGNTYGPENLANWFGNRAAAWCEGASGNGVGETITIRVEGGPLFRRLQVGNGYSKSAQTYTNNGRVKTVEVTADTGLRVKLNFDDRSDLTPVDLMGPAREWIRLRIVDVYPGAKFTDTCLSFLMPDFEHEEAQPEEHEPAGPPQAPPPTVLQPAAPPELPPTVLQPDLQ